MRTKFFLPALLLISVLTATAQSGSFTATPAFPKQGGTINIVFDPGKVLAPTDKKIEGVAYLFNEKANKAKELVLTKTSKGYTGSVQTDADTRAVAFAFSSGEKKLNAGDEGQVVMLYDDQQKPVRGAGNAMALIYNSWGNYLMGIERKPELALSYIEKEYNNFPEQRTASRDMYFQMLNTVKKKEAHPMILKELETLESSKELTEKDYQFLSLWYPRVQQKEKGEEIAKTMKTKFPDGNWKKAEMQTTFYNEKNPENLEKMYAEFIGKYPAKDEMEKSNQAFMQAYIARTYASDKDMKDLEKFKKYMQALPVESKNASFNNIAWGLAEKDQDLEFAKQISWEATNWAKHEMTKPSGEQPAMRTKKQWEEDRKLTYSMYADTYAYILYKLGDYKTGMSFAKDAATIRKMKDPEYNDRYAMLLEKTAPPAQVKKELEQFAKDGVAGKETKAVLKRTYISQKGSEEGYDEYITALNRFGIEKLKAELAKKMINEPAPKFRLVNLQGKDVDLNELKGKVVVVDFWATWCGPCVASFPGMQKAVDKYKNDPNVAFLFIDTWEGGDNKEKREKSVKDFIDKNKYTFNVLYDTPEKDDPNTFVVVNEYKVNGIPTKFVIDHDGKIRFKSVGYSGNEDGLVEEISLMIEMAGTPTQAGSGSGKKAF
jgi:thiol-disulfide isomerase/thioredoxin